MRSSKLLAKWRASPTRPDLHLGHYLPPLWAFSPARAMTHLGHLNTAVGSARSSGDNRARSLYDIDIMIRPSTREKAALYRYLEDGAAGFMIPHVSTPDEARDLVRKVKFRARGSRHGGFGLEANYQLDIAGSMRPFVEHARARPS